MATKKTTRRRRRSVVPTEEKNVEVEAEIEAVSADEKRATEKKRTAAKKKTLVNALKTHMGVISIACDAAKVSRGTYYRWLGNDPAFKKRVDEIEIGAIEFVQHKMYEQVNAGDGMMIRWFLDRKGHKVGIPSLKQHLEVSGDPDNPVQVEGALAIDNLREAIPEAALGQALGDLSKRIAAAGVKKKEKQKDSKKEKDDDTE